ncbi:MAG TPA: alpha/beta fold hydrolase [Firmicutes bacterium]|nr:alpha/beta fold hydrolase [Bacillota bacterium]
MEKAVQFESRGKRVHGVIHLPEGAGPYPCVIICHGFTGDHIGANRMFVRFSREACSQGLAVLRFDFVGSGDSEGDFDRDTHLTGWIQDLGAALNFVCRQPEIDATRIGLLGLSFGGSTVICAPETGLKGRAVVIWSGVVHLRDSFRDTILGGDKWDLLLQGKSIKNFYNKGFALAPSFVEDLLKYDVLREASRLRKTPILIIHGTKDAVVPSDHAKELFETLPGPKRIEFIGDDHVFTDRLSQATALTVDWFKSHLADRGA